DFASVPLATTSESHVRASVTATSTTSLASIRLFADGRFVGEQRVCGATGSATFDADLLAGANLLTAVAFDHRGLASNPTSVRVTSTSRAANRPALWIVAAGVSRYPERAAEWQLTGRD